MINKINKEFGDMVRFGTENEGGQLILRSLSDFPNPVRVFGVSNWWWLESVPFSNAGNGFLLPRIHGMIHRLDK